LKGEPAALGRVLTFDCPIQPCDEVPLPNTAEAAGSPYSLSQNYLGCIAKIRESRNLPLESHAQLTDQTSVR